MRNAMIATVLFALSACAQAPAAPSPPIEDEVVRDLKVLLEVVGRAHPEIAAEVMFDQTKAECRMALEALGGLPLEPCIMVADYMSIDTSDTRTVLKGLKEPFKEELAAATDDFWMAKLTLATFTIPNAPAVGP